MITDQIGQHEVLLPINHSYNKICYSLGFLNTRNSEFFASVENKPITLSYSLVLKSGQMIANQI